MGFFLGNCVGKRFGVDEIDVSADAAQIAHGPSDGRLKHAKIDAWIANAKAGLVSSFATGVLKDIAAVRAAITQPWSNGQVEGQIMKLKLVKRQMYGRAKLDLLEARLLGAA